MNGICAVGRRALASSKNIFTSFINEHNSVRSKEHHTHNRFSGLFTVAHMKWHTFLLQNQSQEEEGFDGRQHEINQIEAENQSYFIAGKEDSHYY